MVSQFLAGFNQLDQEVKDRYLLLESLIKKDQLSKKYADLFAKAAYLPTPFAIEDYDEKNRLATFNFVAPKYTSVPDSAVFLTDFPEASMHRT